MWSNHLTTPVGSRFRGLMSKFNHDPFWFRFSEWKNQIFAYEKPVHKNFLANLMNLAVNSNPYRHWCMLRHPYHDINKCTYAHLFLKNHFYDNKHDIDETSVFKRKRNFYGD